MSLILYRLIVEKDAEDYRRLRLDMLQAHPEAFGSSYEEEKARNLEQVRARIAENHSETRFIMGAFDEERLVGVVGFYLMPSLKMKHKGMIWGMYTDPAYRGRGIGRRLMENALERAWEISGLRQIHLAVVKTNEAARGLYEGLGFATYGIEPDALCVDDVYYDELHMVKKRG